ncbi:VOC family protein [Actinocorallia populi]|uniref:VOC family protein n=1 Tax=Actinocorallia populi TaxID=2079200 RepID=UPI000D08C237|nr:VOC family protein [Actinocorallia populi]
MSEVTGPLAPGTPCWIDLMVPDQRAALDFYRELFGWEGEIGPSESGGYAVCTLNGSPVAGIMARLPTEGGVPAPPNVWTVYLATADADGTEKVITDAGGSVLLPAMDVMGLGRMAVAADPQGAAFGLWEARDFAGFQISGEADSVVWVELNTFDVAAAGDFYRTALALETAPMQGAEGYYSLNAGGEVVGGMGVPDDAPSGTPPHWLVYFAVDDPDATVEKLTRAGGTVLRPPFDMIAGRMAVVQDPQGAMFALLKPEPMNPT